MNYRRIRLINCNPEILGWILESNQILSNKLNLEVPNNWTENGLDIFKLSLDAITKNPNSLTWWSYLAIDNNKNVLIGNCGFKGEPVNGEVEIGYEVCSKFRNKGYATEMVKELIKIAFKNLMVHTILAHTSAKKYPSVSVLKKCGFNFIKEFFSDEDEDKLWKWILSR